MNPVLTIIATIALLNPTVDLDRQQVFCLAEAIYWEAGDMRVALKDKVLVANTVIYSAGKRHITFCEEIYRKGRYPWVKNIRRKIPMDNIFEKRAWELSVEIAILKMIGEDLGWKDEPDYFYSPNAMKPTGATPDFIIGRIVISYSSHFKFLTDGN